MQILMVGVGNVCRSPFAERLLPAVLGDLAPRRAGGDTVQVGSVGVRAVLGAPIDPTAAVELERRGGDPSGFGARQAGEPIAAAADLVLTATRQVRRDLLRIAPAALHRSFTLKEMALLLARDGAHLPVGEGVRAVARELSRRRAVVAREDVDVPDPIGRDVAAHAAVADEIVAALEPVAALLATIAEEG